MLSSNWIIVHHVNFSFYFYFVLALGPLLNDLQILICIYFDIVQHFVTFWKVIYKKDDYYYYYYYFYCY